MRSGRHDGPTDAKRIRSHTGLGAVARIQNETGPITPAKAVDAKAGGVNPEGTQRCSGFPPEKRRLRGCRSFETKAGSPGVPQ